MHWTDDRLDDLARRMDKGFDRVDADIRALRTEVGALHVRIDGRFDEMNGRIDGRFDEMNRRFDALHRTMIQFGASLIASFVGLVVAFVLSQH